MASLTLEFKFRVGGALTNATSVVLSSADGTYGVKRLDTNAIIVADGTAMTNSSTGVYRYTFSTPAAALRYSWVAEATYGGTVYHFEQETVDPTGQTGGRYWGRAQIETILGNLNLTRAANLNNESTDEDADTTARIVADGALADDYTDFWARRGSRGQYAATGTLPILSTDADFAMVQFATNLWAAYLLVRHRVWLATDQATTNQAMIDLKGEAEDLYARLFGALENFDPSKAKPGTMQSIGLTFDLECVSDEFSNG